jgi:hypothetical protein
MMIGKGEVKKMEIKKFVPVLLFVLIIAAVAAVPVFAQEPTPPVQTAAPLFDWAVISSALQNLLIAILVPGAAFFSTWLFAKFSVEKAKLSAEQQTAFELFLKTCVYAAEQMNLKGFINDKLSYVIGLAQAWLTQRKMSMDLEEIRARVESAVAQELNKTKLLAK